MEKQPPLFVSFEIFGDVSGEKNVSGVPAAHHALRHIKTGTGKVGLTVYIDHAADWAAVHSHSKLYTRVFSESATDLERTFHWLFRALVKNQRHPVTGGDLDQARRGFGVLKLLGPANGLSQFINRRALLINRKLGVANDVDEEDVGDLELNLFFNFARHRCLLTTSCLSARARRRSFRSADRRAADPSEAIIANDRRWGRRELVQSVVAGRWRVLFLRPTHKLLPAAA